MWALLDSNKSYKSGIGDDFTILVLYKFEVIDVVDYIHYINAATCSFAEIFSIELRHSFYLHLLLSVNV